MSNSRGGPDILGRNSLRHILVAVWLTPLITPADGYWTGEGSRTSRTESAPVQAVTGEWHYTLTARVRPLLFWISRENVGAAHVAWMEGADGSRMAELLIGSDPARAPMRINRWGYISERAAGQTAEILGVMTTSDEESIDQAKRGLTRRRDAHAFKAIRGSLKDGVASSTVIHLLLADDFTCKDVEGLLRKLPQSGAMTRQKDIPADVEPGFLLAVKALLHEIVDNYNRLGCLSGQRFQRIFLYNSSLYELSLEGSHYQAETLVGGRAYKATIEGRFRTKNTATGEASGFVITFGTRAPFEETPIRIVYRPRWWFETELVLRDGAGAPTVAGAVPRGTDLK